MELEELLISIINKISRVHTTEWAKMATTAAPVGSLLPPRRPHKAQLFLKPSDPCHFVQGNFVQFTCSAMGGFTVCVSVCVCVCKKRKEKNMQIKDIRLTNMQMLPDLDTMCK